MNNENGANTLSDCPPIVPPRRKHSGKILKQQSELSASLSKSNTEQSFNGLPPIPKVKVRPKFL